MGKVFSKTEKINITDFVQKMQNLEHKDENLCRSLDVKDIEDTIEIFQYYLDNIQHKLKQKITNDKQEVNDESKQKFTEIQNKLKAENRSENSKLSKEEISENNKEDEQIKATKEHTHTLGILQIIKDIIKDIGLLSQSKIEQNEFQSNFVSHLKNLFLWFVDQIENFKKIIPDLIKPILDVIIILKDIVVDIYNWFTNGLKWLKEHCGEVFMITIKHILNIAIVVIDFIEIFNKFTGAKFLKQGLSLFGFIVNFIQGARRLYKSQYEAKKVQKIDDQYRQNRTRLNADFISYAEQQNFDGVYFRSIENLAASSQIQNQKNAVQQNDEKEIERLEDILSKESPQLYEFVKKNHSNFRNYLKDGNNALFTINLDEKQCKYNCPKKHGLRKLMTPNSRYTCDICDEDQKQSSPMLGCRNCNQDVCIKCYKNLVTEQKFNQGQMIAKNCFLFAELFSDLLGAALIVVNPAMSFIFMCVGFGSSAIASIISQFRVKDTEQRFNQIKYVSEMLYSFNATNVNIEDFKVKAVLARGTQGRVLLVEHRDSPGSMQALKMLRKDVLLEKHHVKRVKNELGILKDISEHISIVDLKWCFHMSDKIFFVSEFMHGGELFQHVQKNGKLPEDAVRIWTAELSYTLNYLHEKKIIQRNLKSSNVLLDRTGHVRLSDFGLAKPLKGVSSTKSLCGSPEYMAPEMLNGGAQSYTVDWWALGILVYELIVGFPPFFDDDVDALHNKIKNNQIKWPREDQVNMGEFVKAFITHLLEKNAQKRPNFAKIKTDDWLSNLNWNDIESHDVEVAYHIEVKDATKAENFSKELLKEDAQLNVVPAFKMHYVQAQEIEFDYIVE